MAEPTNVDQVDDPAEAGVDNRDKPSKNKSRESSVSQPITGVQPLEDSDIPDAGR